MELRHLRYFVAVAEEQSFTRAAERLWVAQPGLSTQIRRLEEELGVKLFERHARGVVLTEAGEVFLERARAALAAAENCRATVSDLESGLIGAIRLGIATDMGWHHLPALLEDFGATRPDVELTVFESHGGTLLRDLRDRRLDALIAPSVFNSPEPNRLQLGSEPWVVLVGAGHRLAQPGPVSADELDGEALVVTGHRDGAGYDRAVAATLTDLGLSPALRRGGPGPALFGPVAGGEALGLSTASSGATSDLIVRPLRPARSVRFELQWQEDQPMAALREFIRAAEACAASIERGPKLRLAVAA